MSWDKASIFSPGKWDAVELRISDTQTLHTPLNALFSRISSTFWGLSDLERPPMLACHLNSSRIVAKAGRGGSSIPASNLCLR